MSPWALPASLDRRLSLNQAIRELRRQARGDAAEHRLLLQLERELSGPHDFLALGPQGELKKVDPETTTLGDIAVTREVRTPRGVDKVRSRVRVERRTAILPKRAIGRARLFDQSDSDGARADALGALAGPVSFVKAR
jgi:hypothetical protein